MVRMFLCYVRLLKQGRGKGKYTHVGFFRFQSSLDADSRARIRCFAGEEESEPDADGVDPGSCGYASADVGFDHARAYAVDDDERPNEVLAN